MKDFIIHSPASTVSLSILMSIPSGTQTSDLLSLHGKEENGKREYRFSRKYCDGFISSYQNMWNIAYIILRGNLIALEYLLLCSKYTVAQLLTTFIVSHGFSRLGNLSGLGAQSGLVSFMRLLLHVRQGRGHPKAGLESEDLLTRQPSYTAKKLLLTFFIRPYFLFISPCAGLLEALCQKRHQENLNAYC